ncbi:hypothetical protein JVT61DRAFT_6460 [Boletus reticuloceps]|uniref:C2H2-type domain-containing protein n=1 Tax=Boletus reticuloceps TaxID=495285 RepID=A0A8I2YK15_9AGAM|nr:hypothetical protein JVT61DRAFT_6460 [Boletus reticuloceps]
MTKLLQPQRVSLTSDDRYSCRWTTGDVICNSYVRASDFPEHLRSAHGVVGADKASLVCGWVDCFTKMRKENIMRHVNEQHLELRYPCPTCHEQFTRAHTMQNHIARKHPGN